MVDEGHEFDEENESYWTSRRTRRNLLKLAGVGAAAGTAAVVVGGAMPASAADGSTALVGEANNGTSTTSFSSNSDGSPGLAGIGQGSASPGVSGTGKDAPDLKGTGTGRLGLIPAVTGPASPTFSPINVVGNGSVYHEFVRGDNGEIWASRGGPTDTANRWKRVNAVRVDAASGSGGVFVPSRIVDTRSTSSPLTAGATRTIQVASTGSGASAIPADAVAVFGNLTALPASGAGFATSGYLSLYPFGVTRPAPSNLNPVKGGSVASNFFFCGLGSGKLTIYSFLPAHFLIDIFAYVQ